jgi:kumamolisin
MDSRKVFHDSVTPLPPHLGQTPNGLLIQAAKPEHLAEPMTLLFSLALPPDALAALEEKVANGETVSADELQKNFSPQEMDINALTKWLQAQGFTGVEVSKDRTSIYAQATAEQIQKALQVTMVRVTKGGLTYTAAQNAPSLPADIGAPVQAIIGLQPFRHAHKHSRMQLPRNRNRAGLGQTEAGTPSPNLENKPPYLVLEILKAYNADGLPVTGNGQTIAILIDTFPFDPDLTVFWTRNGLPVAPQRIERVNVNGTNLPAPEGEETLDVEWASGVAPGAKIRVYASGSLSFVDLDKALDRILADASTDKTMRQVSISLGLGEKYFGGPTSEIAVQHQKLLKLAALGVNVFVSSGDAGSNPDNTGHGSTGPLQVEYESSDPCVVAVGGTTLKLSPTGQVASETAWASSGGGKSAVFPRPTWQRGAGVLAGNTRLVPDVSLTADPDDGAFLVLHNKVLQIGGTSWSAPVWAGFCALINEARAKAKKKPLPFLNPLLYPLLGTPCFRDITQGNNGAYDAGPGYDMVTGLGVPNVAKLIQALTK